MVWNFEHYLRCPEILDNSRRWEQNTGDGMPATAGAAQVGLWHNSSRQSLYICTPIKPSLWAQNCSENMVHGMRLCHPVFLQGTRVPRSTFLTQIPHDACVHTIIESLCRFSFLSTAAPGKPGGGWDMGAGVHTQTTKCVGRGSVFSPVTAIAR